MPQRLELPMHLSALDMGFENARVLRKWHTDTEKVFWEIVRSNRFDGLKFRCQHPIGAFIADFYCHQYKLVIELDGFVHDEAEQMAYDRNRDDWMQEYGLTVLRFTNQQVMTDIESVKQRIRQVINT